MRTIDELNKQHDAVACEMRALRNEFYSKLKRNSKFVRAYGTFTEKRNFVPKNLLPLFEACEAKRMRLVEIQREIDSLPLEEPCLLRIGHLTLVWSAA